MPEHVMNAVELTFAKEVDATIQEAATDTPRSDQQRDSILGISNLGHCRQYAVLTIRQTEPTEIRDKTAAFIGTVLGQAVEKRMKMRHPDWLFQQEIVFKLPSGGNIPGHPDFVVPSSAATEEFPQAVGDLKSKAELETVLRTGQSQQQIFQLVAYVSACIDKGLLDPSKPIWMGDIFFDRSGRVHNSVAIGGWYDPSVIEQIDSWVGDVIYAVKTNEDGARDQSREFCWAWCEFATACRGGDTDVEGLLDDPGVLAAVEMDAERKVLAKRVKTLDGAVKDVLRDVTGSTGKYNIRWTEIGASSYSVDRKPYMKLSITPVPGSGAGLPPEEE